MNKRAGESIFFDFEKEDNQSIDATETSNWWIKDDYNNIIREGQNNINENIIQLRITKDDTSGLDSKIYRLLVSFENESNGYFDYILDEPLKIDA